MTKAFEEDIETPPTRNIPSPGHLDPDARIPVINLEDGTRLVGEEAPKNKDLVEWLKLHPTYTVDVPSYVPVSITEQRLVAGDSCPVSPSPSPVEHGSLWSLSLSCQCERFPAFITLYSTLGVFLVAQVVKNLPTNSGDVGSIRWRREWQPTPAFLPGKSHGQRSLAGCTP